MGQDQGAALVESGGQNQNPISILVVDDNPMLRYGIRQLFEQKTGIIQLVAEIAVCEAAWEILKANEPRVLLLDIELRDGCAYKLISKVTSAALETKILVYSAKEGEAQIIQAFRCGAHGYITKGAKPHELLEAIRVIAEIGSYLDPAVSSKVIGQLGRVQERRQSMSRRLTRREFEVLHGIARGKRNRDIATELFISERTVKYHLSSVFAKLEVRNRTEAVKYAFEHGFID